MPILNTRPIICNAELSAKVGDFSGAPVNFKKSLRTQEWSDRQARYIFGIPRKFWIKPVGVVFRFFFWKIFCTGPLLIKNVYLLYIYLYFMWQKEVLQPWLFQSKTSSISLNINSIIYLIIIYLPELRFLSAPAASAFIRFKSSLMNTWSKTANPSQQRKDMLALVAPFDVV